MFCKFDSIAFHQAVLKGSVVATHIDLQSVYEAAADRHRDTRQCFANVNGFAADLRGKKIPNYWVFNGPSEGVFPYAGYLQTLRSPDSCYNEVDVDLDIYPDLFIKPSEIIAAKTDANVATNKQFIDLLKNREQATVILTGMYYDACYSASVVGLLENDFHVVVCPDATDCLPKRRDKFAKGLIDVARKYPKGQLSVARRHQILAAT